MIGRGPEERRKILPFRRSAPPPRTDLAALRAERERRHAPRRSRARFTAALLASIAAHLCLVIGLALDPLAFKQTPPLALKGPEVDALLTPIRPNEAARDMPDLPYRPGILTAVEFQLRPEMVTLTPVVATTQKVKPSPLAVPPVLRPSPLETEAEANTEPVRIVLREDFSAQTALPPAASSSEFRILTIVRPEYPREAIHADHQGLVTLEVRVGLSGRVLGTKIVESPGDTFLEHAAVIAMMQWEFKPLELDGKRVAFVVVVPFRFRLLD